ncbi:hypothetical protein FACS1894130_06070 [Spirochaetia bacterium]|nr:hypothetical protein FACS1894130_06070 [Spirochaetia bacterium]
MVLQLKEIEDIASINAMLESNDSKEEKKKIEKEQFSEAYGKLKICGNKVQQVTGMIYEYLMTGVVIAFEEINLLNPEEAVRMEKVSDYRFLLQETFS